MRATGLVILVLLLVLAAAALLLPVAGGMVGVQVLVPDGNEQAARAAALVTWAQTADWGAFLAAQGLDLDRDPIQRSLSTLVNGGLVASEGRVEGMLRYQITGRDRLATSVRQMHAAAALVEHRLEVQARMDAFPHVDPARRRALAWQLHAAGLPQVVAPFLGAAAATETDEGVRACLLELQQRLGHAHRTTEAPAGRRLK